MKSRREQSSLGLGNRLWWSTAGLVWDLNTCGGQWVWLRRGEICRWSPDLAEWCSYTQSWHLSIRGLGTLYEARARTGLPLQCKNWVGEPLLTIWRVWDRPPAMGNLFFISLKYQNQRLTMCYQKLFLGPGILVSRIEKPASFLKLLQLTIFLAHCHATLIPGSLRTECILKSSRMLSYLNC